MTLAGLRHGADFIEDGAASLQSYSGTSGSAPLWGGLVALADQYAHHDLGFVNPAIYSHRPQFQLPQGVSRHHERLKRLPGRPGWDPVTGWGTPNAPVLVPLLARFTSRSNT